MADVASYIKQDAELSAAEEIRTHCSDGLPLNWTERQTREPIQRPQPTGGLSAMRTSS